MFGAVVVCRARTDLGNQASQMIPEVLKIALKCFQVVSGMMTDA